MPISSAPRQPTMILQQIPSCASEEVRVNSFVKQLPPPKKSVRFYEVVEVKDALHLCDMTSKEISKSWYCRSEYVDFKRALSTEVKALMLGKPLGPEFSKRGLEYRTREGSNRRKANKVNSIHAVLDEQDLQLERGYVCPETIRDIYLKQSAHCATNAHLLGKADEVESKLIAETDRKTLEKTLRKTEEIEETVSTPTKSGQKILRRLFAKKRAVVEEIKKLKRKN